MRQSSLENRSERASSRPPQHPLLGRAKRVAVALTALLATAGCALLGEERPFPDAISTSGVGPFRPLDDAESPFEGAPLGRALNLGNQGVDRASHAAGGLYYGAADILDTPPTRDALLRNASLDPAQFESFEIYRSTDETDLGFANGAVVLSATEAWEGASVSDPFAVELPDGRVRLYYVGEGGIGVATAANGQGAFTRDGAEPVLANDATDRFAGPLGSPTVVLFEETYYLFFDDTRSIWVATSVDGLTFELLDGRPESERPDPIRIPGPLNADDETPEEVAFVSPGAYVGTSPIGREWIRVYVEVHHAVEAGSNDDERMIIATATADGLTFERALLPAVESTESPGTPTIRPMGDGVSLMYYTTERSGDVERRVVRMAVDPASHRFAPEDSDS